MKKTCFKFTKIVAFAVFGMLSWISQAQNTTTQIARQISTLESSATATNTSVKLIDNKGTIKYLQVSNGITAFTDLVNDKQTTTWQLGGSLTDNTYIDVDGNVFALDGIELVNIATSLASTDTTSLSDHGTGTGWTLLVRDEATGNIKKLKATDLIQAGSGSITALAADQANGFIDIVATGIPTTNNIGKIWVYRNGAKLNGADYTITDDKVTVTQVAGSWELFTDDYLEVQWVK